MGVTGTLRFAGASLRAPMRFSIPILFNVCCACAFASTARGQPAASDSRCFLLTCHPPIYKILNSLVR